MSTAHLSEKQIVSDYIRKVSGLYEVDYGDFKRKLGAYTNNLEAVVGRDARAQRVIQEIREKTIFNTPGRVDLAKDIVVSLAETLM